VGVYQVCSNKSPGAPGAYIQVSDLRAMMALLFGFLIHHECDKENLSFIVILYQLTSYFFSEMLYGSPQTFFKEPYYQTMIN
jgi:hypothetical protein